MHEIIFYWGNRCVGTASLDRWTWGVAVPGTTGAEREQIGTHGGIVCMAHCRRHNPRPAKRRRTRRHCRRDFRGIISRSDAVTAWGRSTNAQFTPPARHDETVQSVSCLARRCELDNIAVNVFRLQIFCRRQSWVVAGIQFTPPKRTRHRLDIFFLSGVAMWISFDST